MQSHDSSINLLFTSVGRRVELLRAFRRAYQALDLDGTIVALDIDPIAPALQLADRPYIIPGLHSPDYIPTLVDICTRERVKIVFPLIDPDIHVLARHRSTIERTGARLAVVSQEAAGITADKWQTVQLFQRLGLPSPRSWLPGDIDMTDVEFPLFVKPRSGSASQNTFKVRDVDEARFFFKYVHDPIVQEYLPGPEITSDVICDLEGDVLAVVCRQRIEVRWGEVAKGITVYDPSIAQACVKIARSIGAIGPINIQCMMKNGVAYFTEVNARFGGGVPLGIAAGVDSPCWLLSKIAGLPIEIPPLGTYQTGLRMTRFDDSFILTEAQYAQMAGHHLRSG